MSTITLAETAIESVEVLSNRVGRAMVAQMALEDGRAAEKSFAVRRLMGTHNPETGKEHSASSAEKVVESDPDYMGYRARQYEAVIEVQRAQGAFSAAQFRAQLSVGLAVASATVGA